jgi:hypothetical protein
MGFAARVWYAAGRTGVEMWRAELRRVEVIDARLKHLEPGRIS